MSKWKRLCFLFSMCLMMMLFDKSFTVETKAATSEVTKSFSCKDYSDMVNVVGTYIREKASNGDFSNYESDHIQVAYIERSTDTTSKVSPEDMEYQNRMCNVDLKNEIYKYTGDPKEGYYLTYLFGAASPSCSDFTYDASTGRVTCKIHYIYVYKNRMTKERDQEISNKAKEIITGLHLEGKTDYNKVLSIYRWLTGNVSFDEGADNAMSIYGALIDGRSVCEGYASSMYYLCNMAGIECYYDSGITTDGKGHAWNIVTVDGGDTYYYCDATNDNHISYFEHFLVGQDTLNKYLRHTNSSENDSLYKNLNIPNGDYHDNDTVIWSTDCENKHIYGNNYYVNPTCTSQGYYEKKCENCWVTKKAFVDGKIYQEDALGHDYQSSIIDATCTEAGYTKNVCSRCGDTFSNNDKPALGHEYKENVIQAGSCTEDRIVSYTCTRCSDSYQTKEKSSGHDYKVTNRVESTCAVEGRTEYTCAKCGGSYVNQIEKKSSHSWDAGSVIKEASEDETGIIRYTCSVCGTYYDKEIPPTGNHTWNSGVVTVQPTTSATGVKTYTCTVCKATKTETIEKLPAPVANTITAKNFVKTYSTKTQSLNIGAKCLGGATLTYSSNSKYITVNSTGTVSIKAKYIGAATITIKSAATSQYAETVKKITVTVGPTRTAFTSVKNVKGKKIQVKWKKNIICTGYQVQYSTSSKFASGNKVATIKKNKIVSTTLSKLTKGKYYYVRIRTYKTVSKKNYYSGWSAVKKVKVTK